MSPANLYRFYDGKLAIAAAVVEAMDAAIFSQCDKAAALAGDKLVPRISAFLKCLVTLLRRQMKEEPFLYDLRLAVCREMPEMRQAYLQSIEQRLSVIFGETPLRAQRPASTTPVSEEPPTKARLTLTACASFVLPWMMLTQPFGDPAPQIQPLVQCLIQGLGELAETEPGERLNNRRPEILSCAS